MVKLVESSDVEQIVRKLLREKGCTLSVPKGKGQTGSDITAISGKSTWFVEVIGFQSHPSIRSREFYEAFFRIVSRNRDNLDDILVLALPKRFKNGMAQRKHQYLIAWEKLGKTFPNLYIWYVDTKRKMVEEYPWLKPVD